MDCADYLSYIFFKVLCDFYPFGSEWFSHIKLHIRDAVSRYKLLARFTSFYECKSLNFLYQINHAILLLVISLIRHPKPIVL